MRIRRELRLRGFATAMLLFQRGEVRTTALSDRLKTYEVDTVLWFSPPRDLGDIALRLSDAGIRLLGISQGEPTDIPCRYAISRDSAIKQLLHQWKLSSLDKITVVETQTQRSAATEETLRRYLHEFRLQPVFVNFSGRNIASFLGKLRRAKTDGLIFPSSTLASLLCFRRPSAVTDLLGSKRVAFLEGPATMPFASLPDVEIDLVKVDWQGVAETIVGDLISQMAFKTSTPTVFEAEAHLRVPFSRFSQKL